MKTLHVLPYVERERERERERDERKREKERVRERARDDVSISLLSSCLVCTFPMYFAFNNYE